MEQTSQAAAGESRPLRTLPLPFPLPSPSAAGLALAGALPACSQVCGVDERCNRNGKAVRGWYQTPMAMCSSP